jgi:hypothetical protein
MSLSESAASIGLRTQSIQLMRDAMYRICEGYLSGALTDGSFETLHRRLQSSMVAILAIEQLTGAVKASQVVLGGESSTGAADAVQKLTSQTAEANTARLAAENAVVTATTEQKAAQGALDDARKAKEDKPDDTAAATAVTEAEAKLDEKTKALTPAKKTLSDAEDAYKAIDEGRRAALSGTTSASSTGQMQAVSTSPALDPEAVKSVAEAVTDIVHTTLELQYSNELCTTLMVGRAYDKEVAAEKDSPVVEKCLELLQQTVDRISADTRIAVANAEAYRDRVKRLSAAELAKLPPEPKRPPPILFSN